MEKSLLDYAFDYVNAAKDSVKFADIWAYVVKEAGLTEEEANAKVARFYTNLMLDGRFVTLGENIWDLRVRHTFDKVHIDMREVYSDVESDDDKDIEEEDEEEQYDDSFKENNDEGEEETSESNDAEEENL